VLGNKTQKKKTTKNCLNSKLGYHGNNNQQRSSSLYAQQHPKKKKQKSSHLSPFFDQPTDSDMASKENAVALVDPHQLASVIRSSRLDKVSAFCENKTIQ
jgi:hypothetical protein